MAHSESGPRITRRKFTQYLMMLGIGGQALLQTRSLRAAIVEAQDTVNPMPWPQMAYRTLGRTGFKASRLIYGCGAALSRSPADRLLNIALEAGVNVYDVGSSRYYDDAEKNLSPFIKKHRDDIFLISKSMTYLDADADEEVSVADAKKAASTWLKLLDESLGQLDIDHVDAYYVMAANNPVFTRSEEIYNAFETAKKAGKVTYVGLSTHENAQAVLETAIETGWYDLATVAITPAGWYDWANRGILDGTPPLAALQPFLDRARNAGMGLVGMKSGRYLAGRGWLGRGDPSAFNRFYDARLLNSELSDFQRSYAYVLEHGLDVVNADIQNYQILKENFVAAATAHEYFV